MPCSCDINIKNIYYKYYDKYNIIKIDNDSYIQTYIDLYIMMQSKIIILSQRHSSFSLLCALKNRNTFVYMYDDDIINKSKYSDLNNFIYYKNLFNN